MFTKAIVRKPAANFAEGLTTVNLGVPSFELVLEQHQRYCAALRDCGLKLSSLEADERFPDSTFVEDTAILTPKGAIITRPGAASRAGEVKAIETEVLRYYGSYERIKAPGTLDGGDICEAGEHFFLGVSHRTNEEGARQLGAHLAKWGYSFELIDIRAMTSILHLKSGIAYIGDDTLVLMDEMAAWPVFARFRKIIVPPPETYGANCVRVNARVVVAEGFPHLTAELIKHGFDPSPLPMSEFRKMDGGLSCLSLRF